MLCSEKIEFFIVIFALSLSLNLASASSSSSAEDEKVVKRATQREFNTFVMKFNEKMDFLSDRVDQMEQRDKGYNDAFAAVHEMLTNITRAISNSNDELAKKIGDKFNKMEEKQNKMESNILFHLLNATEKEKSAGSDGVWSGVTSQCQSMCQAKLTVWANQTGSQLRTKVERMELCDSSEPKAVNTCDPNPCLHGGRCESNSTGSDYVCVCQKFRSGSRCQNEKCTVEDKCWRYKDTIMYTAIETALTWAEAKVKCESLNMTLAMPKDFERSQFLFHQLEPIYRAQEFLWLGLKRDESGSGWFWLDGSDLGEYTGGWTAWKTYINSYFAVLCLTRDDSFMWTWGSATNQFYALCETQLISH